MCVSEYFLVPGAKANWSAQERCHPCLTEAGKREVACPQNTTLASVGLARNRWRLTSLSRTVSTCIQGATTGKTACVGGGDSGTNGAGYCLANHSGPFCQVCSVDNKYFNDDEGQCIDCPRIPNVVGILAGVAATQPFIFVSL